MDETQSTPSCLLFYPVPYFADEMWDHKEACDHGGARAKCQIKGHSGLKVQLREVREVRGGKSTVTGGKSQSDSGALVLSIPGQKETDERQASATPFFEPSLPLGDQRCAILNAHLQLLPISATPTPRCH